jgi:hypothetical protein
MSAGPLQNRADPYGEIFATPECGAGRRPDFERRRVGVRQGQAR